MITALVPLPVALPLLVAAILAAVSKVIPRLLADLLGIATALAVTILAALLTWHATEWGRIVYWFGGWSPRPGGIAIGIAFVIDPLGAGMATFVGLLGTAALVFSWRYFESVGALFHALMLVFLGSMAGFCLTGDLFTMFVFFELMGTAAFALTAHKIESDSIEGALNFAIINSLGAFTTLWGIALMYGKFGALNLAQLGRAVEAAGPVAPLVIIALGLISCGFLTKAAIAPFHFWLSDAHAVAPTPVCLLFSGIMVELGLFGVARVYWTVFAGATTATVAAFHAALLGMGIVTAVIGAVMALRQRHLKRLLAFSTVSHAGIMLCCLIDSGVQGLGGTVLYIFSHGLIKGSLFLSAGIVLHRFGTVDLSALRNQGRATPWTGILMAVGGLALAGLPPFGTWTSKVLMDLSLHQTHDGWSAWILALAAAMTGAAVLRAAGWIFLGFGTDKKREGPTNKERRETHSGSDYTPASMLGTAFALLLLGAVLGSWNGFARWSLHAAGQFVEFPGYQASVLQDVRMGPTAPSFAFIPHPVVVGLAVSILAVVIAGLALARDHIPNHPIKLPVTRLLTPPLRWLREVHSGNVCDYAAWFTVGAAVLCVLFLAVLHPL